MGGGVDISGIWEGRRIWSFQVCIPSFLPYLSVPPQNQIKSKLTDVPYEHTVGQIPFNSTITGKTEQLPVTVSIVARRGCDFMLLDLLEGLAERGIVGSVKTGREAF